jgi:maltose alpha-D-glucosyltransferase/alpha-amylase
MSTTQRHPSQPTRFERAEGPDPAITPGPLAGTGRVETASPADPAHWFERDPLWFKRAIFYEIHLRGFYDGDDDGFGDFVGLTEKLDYLHWLGVDCLWLLPMYASPLRDGGYDIANFLEIHSDYGTLEDFETFILGAHERGIRVIADLVMNHTSSDHAWFQRARTAPAGSPERDWYVWSDTEERYQDARIIFTDTEASNWTWDPVAGQYYWHRFFSHQPDLNYDNPAVHAAMLDVLRFWLDRGLDGLRLDAVPYLYEREGTSGENLPETHAFLRKVRATVDEEYPDRVLLAEANQWPEDVVEYFGGGDGDECHMAFHFPVMPRMFMSLRREDATPMLEILERTPEIPRTAQWGLFLRNHDELTLEMVTDEERDYMYAEYAKDPRMKLNLGIRRRLAPLLDNGRDEIELMTAILFSLPGSPVLYYGDEIAMGDNIYLGDRDGVRTPMQWTGDRNGGFSRADFAQLYAPPLMDPVYGFQAVNVEAQLRTPTSLLRWLHRFIALRKAHPVFGLGSYRALRPSNPRIFAHLRTYADDIVMCVHNVARSAQAVELDLSEFEGRYPVEMFGRSRFPRIGELPYLLTLGPRGFFWFLLERGPDDDDAEKEEGSVA